MKITIDTKAKTLFVEEATVKELLEFIKNGDYKDFKIKQEVQIQLVPEYKNNFWGGKKPPFINTPKYEDPLKTPFTITPDITCSNSLSYTIDELK